MSVTILNEVEKAEVLVAGLKKNLNEVKSLGITSDAINRLEETSAALRQKDEEVDALRRQATFKGHENRELLAGMKEQMLSMRKAVKSHYIQPEWIKFGVQDKR